MNASNILKRGLTVPALVSSLFLILGRMAASGLGFLAWLLAARLYSPAEVGLASGTISAMMLCVQLALLGVGPAVITIFPHHQQRPSAALNAAFNIVAGAALLVAGLFVGLAGNAFHELRVIGAIPLYMLLFLGMTLFGTIGQLLDHISIALRRGDQVFLRSLMFGGVTLAFVATLPWITSATNALAIFGSWAMAGLTTCVLGCVQVARSLPQYRYRPQVERLMARKLLGIGLPNHVLTVVERAPAQILPILVVELLSPAANATWYTIWMMTWVILLIPVSTAQTLFAEASRQPEALLRETRRSIRSALAIGGVAAAGLALTAGFVLSLLGHSYAVTGTTPLRILLLGVLPVTYIQAYFAICRATHRLRQAAIVATISGFASVLGAALVITPYGLTGMAVAWLVVQLATGIWAMSRIRSLPPTYTQN